MVAARLDHSWNSRHCGPDGQKLQNQVNILFPKKTKEGMDEFKSQVEWMIKNQMFKK